MGVRKIPLKAFAPALLCFIVSLYVGTSEVPNKGLALLFASYDLCHFYLIIF